MSKKRHILPGFHPSLGWTVTWLSLVVLLPLAALKEVRAKPVVAERWRQSNGAEGMVGGELAEPERVRGAASLGAELG